MRGRKAKSRTIPTDPLFKSRVVTRMVNRVMWGGKRSLAEKIVYGAINNLAEDQKEATQLFEEAVQKVMPKIEVRSRRVGGATYQVPNPVRHDRSEALAIRWIVEAARNKKGKTMIEHLTDELKSILQGTGDAIKKKEEIYRVAEANRAFAHFKW